MNYAQNGSDSLQLFYMELHQKAKNLHAFNKNHKKPKKQPSKVDVAIKFPSLYVRNNDKENWDESDLSKRIKKFEERVQGLQFEALVQQKVDKLFMKHLIMKSQTSASRQFSPHNCCMGHCHPYHPQNFPQRRSQRPFQRRSQLRDSKRYMHSLTSAIRPFFTAKRKLKAAMIAVYFSILFPKYSRTVTLTRFDNFKKQWEGIQNSFDNQIYGFFSQKAIDTFFTDQFNQESESEKQQRVSISGNLPRSPTRKLSKQTKQQESSNINQNQRKKSIKIKLQSAPYKQSKASQQLEDDQEQGEVVEMQLQIEQTISLTFKIMEAINSILADPEFKQFHSYLMHCLSMQFVPDYMFQRKYYRYMNLHKDKSYAFHNQLVSKYLLTVKIYLNVIKESRVLMRTGTQYYEANLTQSQKKQAYFYLFLREIFLQEYIQLYVVHLSGQLQKNALPAQNLLALAKTALEHEEQESSSFFENEGFLIEKENVILTAKKLIQYHKSKAFALLDAGVTKLLHQLNIKQKQELNEVKKQVLSMKLRKDPVTVYANRPKSIECLTVEQDPTQTDEYEETYSQEPQN